MTHLEAFTAAYERLAGIYGQTPEADAMRLHYEAVRDIPLESFAAVATRLAKTLKWWPKPAEWLQAHEAEQDARRRAIDRSLDARQETYCCLTCKDTGWEERQCSPGRFCGRCQRRGHLYDHPYVTECECRATNPVYQSKQESHRKTVGAKQRAA